MADETTPNRSANMEKALDQEVANQAALPHRGQSTSGSPEQEDNTGSEESER